jgi:type I restriction enzyme M protein
MTEEEYERLKKMDRSKLREDLYNEMAGKPDPYDPTFVTSNELEMYEAAYILYWAQLNGNPIKDDELGDFFENELDARQKDNVTWIPNDQIIRSFDESNSEPYISYEEAPACDNVSGLVKLLNVYSNEELLSYLLFEKYDIDFSCISTPASLGRLAAKMLDVKEGEKVLDIGTGNGIFFREAAVEEPKAKYYMVENNYDLAEGAFFRACAMGLTIQNNIYGNVFTDFEGMKFDKIFCDLGKNYKTKNTVTVDSAFVQKHPEIEKYTDEEWVFALKICTLLSKEGKGALIVPSSSLTSPKDSAVRQWLIDHGYLEAVVLLPGKMYEEDTNISAALLLLSRDNKSVKFIDAWEHFSSYREKGKVINYLAEEDLEQILSGKEGHYRAQNQAIAKQQYHINPAGYVQNVLTKENSIALGDAILKIHRGIDITSKELDAAKTEETGNFYYITAGDIQNGILSDDLIQLQSDNPKWSGIGAFHDILLLTKNGRPYKSVVLSHLDPWRALVNRNFWIIELDPHILDANFVKMFLDSPRGQDTMNKLSTGGVITILTEKAVREIRVPKLSIKDQVSLGKKYIACNEEVREKQLEMEKILRKRDGLIEKAMEQK